MVVRRAERFPDGRNTSSELLAADAGYTVGAMVETQRDQLLLSLVGAACIGVGILIAVAVPESDGPAWAMAVAGCLAAGVLLLGRVAFAHFRPRRRAAL